MLDFKNMSLTELLPLAESGDADAQFWAGRKYHFAKTPDYAAARAWYLRAAEQGHAFAQNNIGYMYEAGQGCERNVAQAFSWYMKAAKQNDAAAQYGVAMLFAEGRGCRQNDNKALLWFKKAAEQGHVEAQYNLALIYRAGRGCKPNDAEALSWCTKAAMQGYAPAQTNFFRLAGRAAHLPAPKQQSLFEMIGNVFRRNRFISQVALQPTL